MTTSFKTTPARILMLDEIVYNQAGMPLDSLNVRVLGRLQSYNVHTNMAVIEYPSNFQTPVSGSSSSSSSLVQSVSLPVARLEVDTTLLGVFEYKLGSLYQWIGELQVSDTLDRGNNDGDTVAIQTGRDADTGDRGKGQPSLMLYARIVRDMSQLDTRLYERALRLRRAVLATEAQDGPVSR
eukprot:jgi/Hompol1/509/HPOL_005339-RA